jgi:signal peptidase I
MSTEELIKRVIGLPGETVKVEGGIVSINDVPLQESYIAARPAYSGKWEVPAGYLFVLGDNRNDSSDSHSWGLLPAENVAGKAILVYWPLPEWMIIQHNQPAMAAP